VRVGEGAVALHHRDLAHLRHGRQAAGQLADDLLLVRAQLAEVDARFGESDAHRAEVLDFIHHRGDVQQRLRRDAADVETDAAEAGVALDQHRLQPEVGGTESGRIAARAGAEHEHVAVEVAGLGGACSRGLRAADAGLPPPGAGGELLAAAGTADDPLAPALASVAVGVVAPAGVTAPP
jgi:hypothetical protein